MSELKQEVSAKNQFTSFFNARVHRLTEAIEKKRKSCLMNCVLIAIAGSIISLLTAVIVPIAPIIFFVLLVVVPIGCLREAYGNESKSKILPAILSFWGKYKYIPKRLSILIVLYNAYKAKIPFKLAFQDYCAPRYPEDFDFNILSRLYDFSGYKLDDCIIGDFNGLKMQVNEIELYTLETYQSRRGSRKHKKVHFKGVVLASEMNKPFKGVTGISKRNLDTRRLVAPVYKVDFSENDFKQATEYLNKTPEELKEIHKKASENPQQYAIESQNVRTVSENEIKNCKRVTLEDVEFEKHFKTFSTDQIEARYILTTAFMERFKKMASKHKYNIEALFVDEKVYILISSSENWFEVPYYKSATDINNYKSVITEFSSLLSMLDTLKLEQDIGM